MDKVKPCSITSNKRHNSLYPLHLCNLICYPSVIRSIQEQTEMRRGTVILFFFIAYNLIKTGKHSFRYADIKQIYSDFTRSRTAYNSNLQILRFKNYLTLTKHDGDAETYTVTDSYLNLLFKSIESINLLYDNYNYNAIQLFKDFQLKKIQI